jgi:hypothetical protein
MTSRYEHLQDPKQRRHLVLFRSAAAVGVAVALLAVSVFLPKSNTPAAGNSGSGDTASLVAAKPAPAGESALEYSGTMGHFPEQPVDQPPTF